VQTWFGLATKSTTQKILKNRHLLVTCSLSISIFNSTIFQSANGALVITEEGWGWSLIGYLGMELFSLMLKWRCYFARRKFSRLIGTTQACSYRDEGDAPGRNEPVGCSRDARSLLGRNPDPKRTPPGPRHDQPVCIHANS